MRYLLFILILTIPFVYASPGFVDELGDFVKGYFELTGAVILKVSEIVSDLGTEKLNKISPTEENKLEHNYGNCKDSDLLNYYEKGICKQDNKKIQDYCSKDGSMVMEFWCNENSFCKGSLYVCEGKCVDGACVAE